MPYGAAIGAGASVVGGLMQAIAASNASRAMNRAFERELSRQEGYRNQAFDVFQPALEQRGVETARDQIDQGSQRRQALYAKVANAPLALGGQPDSARERANYTLLGRNRANLGGYSDWALDQLISNIRSQDELNKVSSFAGGTAGVFPYRLSDAQHSSDDLALIGSLISSIGGSAPALQQYFGAPPQQQQTSYYGMGGRGSVMDYNVPPADPNRSYYV